MPDFEPAGHSLTQRAARQQDSADAGGSPVARPPRQQQDDRALDLPLRRLVRARPVRAVIAEATIVRMDGWLEGARMSQPRHRVEYSEVNRNYSDILLG